jgi:hypothetical protein
VVNATTVRLTVSSPPGTTNYKYSLNSGTTYTTVSPPQTAGPIVVTGLTAGNTYPTVVKAFNTAGDSPASNTLNVYIEPPQAVGLAFGTFTQEPLFDYFHTTALNTFLREPDASGTVDYIHNNFNEFTTTDTNYSTMFWGFFDAPTTGTYTFVFYNTDNQLANDDLSYFYYGANVAAPSVENIDKAVFYPDASNTSVLSVSLSAGTVPVLMYFGQSIGGQECSLGVIYPDSSTVVYENLPFVQPPATPDPPTDVTAVATDSTIEVSWTAAPASSFPFLFYELTITINSNTSSVTTISAASTSFTVSNAQLFTTYIFSIKTVGLGYRLSTAAQSNTVSLRAPRQLYLFNQGSINQDSEVLNAATGVYDAVLYGNATIDTNTIVRNNGSLYLDGATYIQLDTTNVVGTTGCTFAAWFKYTSDGWARLFDFGSGSGDNNVLYAPGNGVAVFTSGGIVQFSDAAGQADDAWHFFALTMSAAGTDNYKVYLDGLLIVSRTITYPTVEPRIYCYIGNSNWNNDPLAVGYISNFMVFDYVLTAIQIQDVMGAVVYLNALDTASYNPSTPTIWNNLNSSKFAFTLYNNPTFDNESVVFNTYAAYARNDDLFLFSQWSLEIYYYNISSNNGHSILTNIYNGNTNNQICYSLGAINQNPQKWDDIYVWAITNQEYKNNNPFSVLNNTWVHLIGSYDGQNYTLYVNGVLYDQTNVGAIGAAPNQSGTLLMRAWDTDYNDFRLGKVQSMKMYSYAVTPEYANTLYKRIIPTLVIDENLQLYLDAGDARSYSPGTPNRWNNLINTHDYFHLYGGPTYSTDFGGCLSFVAANNQYGESTTPYQYSVYSIECWVYWVQPPSSLNSQCIITSIFTGSTINYCFYARSTSTNEIGFGLYGGSFQDIGYTLPTNNAWYHIVLSKTSTEMSLFINGQVIGSTSVGTAGVSANATRLMCKWDELATLTGKLAVVRIYNRALTFTETLSHYSLEQSRFQ